MTNPNDSVNTIYETRFGQHGVWIDYLDNGGLTKREYFAAMALQGLIANRPPNVVTGKEYVEGAVEFADLLIEELNKPKTHGNENHQP